MLNDGHLILKMCRLATEFPELNCITACFHTGECS